MKNTLISVVLAVAVAACVQADNAVYSSNAVGYVEVTVPGNGGVCLIGLNLKRVNGDGPLLASEVFGTDQLEQGDEPGLADSVYVWNPDTGDSGGYATVFQRLDGAFYDAATMTPLDPVIPTGAAVFVRTKAGTTDRLISLIGEVVYDTPQSMTIPAGLSVLANPYAAPLDLNSSAGTGWSGATAATLPTLADNVWIWNPDKQAGGGYDVFFLHSSTRKWHRIDAPSVVATDAVLAIGRGAFYSARQPYANSLTRPYPR
jgi:hypothetical protein